MRKIVWLIVLSLIPVSASSQQKKASQVNRQDVGAYTYNKSTGVTSIRATMMVPAEPLTNHNQSISSWIGLEPEDTKTVMQSVLQWGRWANGSQKGWNIACWLAKIAKDDTFSHESSKFLPVQVGQKVTGIVELVSVKNGLYTYRCQFEGYPESLLTYQTRDPFNTAVLETEVQDMTACSDYSPANTLFGDVSIASNGRDLSSLWKLFPLEDPRGCGMKVRPGPDRKSFSIGLR